MERKIREMYINIITKTKANINLNIFVIVQSARYGKCTLHVIQNTKATINIYYIVDTGTDSYSKGCGFKPRYDQHVVFLSKTLYHNYSTLPR